MRRCSAIAAGLWCASLAAPATAQTSATQTTGIRTEDDEVPTIVVTAPGGRFDLDDAIQLDASDITRNGTPDLLGVLTRTLPGASLQDAQGNPWQPNLVYRGFVASPLQGQAQGIAVYLDGARFNQPFGDTVGFDLIPDAAIRSVTLADPSPAYGLNALGGSMVLQTATGRSDPGMDASLAAGRFGERTVSLSAGGRTGAFSYFGAFQSRRERGWRDFSPSDLVNGYADLGLDGVDAGVHVKFIAADTDLTGNGVAPVELLAARRRSVFSWPDNSQSRYGRISVHPWVALGSDTRIEATAYRQRLKVSTLNGDVADIEPCEDDEALLCLEAAGDDDDDDDGDGGEASWVLTDPAGLSIPAVPGVDGYGVLNRGNVHTRSMGVLAQIIDERALWTGENHLALGFSYDTSTSTFGAGTTLGALTEDRSVEGLGVQIVQEDGAIAPVRLTATTRYWGLFLADSLPLTDSLRAEIGLRYNRARIELIDGIGTALNGTHHFSRLNPGIEFDWRVAPALTLRAGYTETNRTPTPAELSCADEDAPCSLTNFFVADPPLKQVVAKTFEVGAAGQIAQGGWTLDWLASGWRTTNTDDIQYVASEVRGRAYFRNMGSTRRQGLELTVKAQNGGWRIAAGYAFTDATFRQALAVSSPSHPLADEDGQIEVRPGDRLPGIARHGATLSADYEGELGSRTFSIGGDVLARSGQGLVGDEANLTPRVPGYVLVHLRASLELVPGLSLFANVRNLLDRDYATFGTFSEVDEVDLAEAPDASNPRAYGPGAPRRWTLGLRARF
ncbi:TonB-dependent receptor [Novosphingobium decolorationis]|uniref:TonB-dependent receptor n=1 Tax=Novosphingobium decolorationis TaxID=2698673 RepID=A0ABX8E842_9SPHN|nr:TonB-dependent receptor [Novosphingobium decolorationis]QVM85224.1 TonB-dependent receptor [Novosphingobium decolorationis]